MAEEQTAGGDVPSEDDHLFVDPEAKAPESEQAGDDAAAEQDGQAETPKPKKTAQDRIDELTRARREAEREADYWRTKATQPAPPPQDDARPDPTAFEYGTADERYIEALAEWKAGEIIDRRFAERSQAEQAGVVDREWNTRQAAFAAKTPDYEDLVIRNRALSITPQMAEAIKTSEAGPDVAYHLAKNPAEATRIAALTPLAQAREIGRIEARLAEPARPQTKIASDAPEAPPQVRGTGGRFAPADDTNDFKAFEAKADAMLSKT